MVKTYTAREVVELGVQMRTAQKAYFRDRDRTALMAARNAETAFDMAAARIMAQPTEPAQPSLFDEGGA